MSLKFKSPLELSGHRAIQHTDVAQTLVVKVVTKTNAHPEYGNGSTYGYTIAVSYTHLTLPTNREV